MYPCQADKDGSCELIWPVLHPGLSEGSFGNKGRLGRTGQIATAGVTSFQCHGRQRHAAFGRDFRSGKLTVKDVCA